MAVVTVEVVNNSKQTVRLSLDESSDELAHLRRLVKREDLDSVRVVPAARKSAASK